MKQKKALGFWMLTALVAGNMIGSGIFLLPTALAAIGSISIIAWCLTAFGALMLALVFAGLSQQAAKVGGPYAYCRDAYGDFIGFEVAYTYWIAIWVGNAALVVAFVSYLSVFFPAIAHNRLLSFEITVATVWFFTIVNIIGVRTAGIVQLLSTILKLLPLILISVVGLFYVSKENLAVFNVTGHTNFSALTTAATLTLWSFIGVESATVPADDVINPERNIPRATIIGTLLAAVIYILSAIAVMGVIPNAELVQADAPYALAATHFFGPWGKDLVALGAIISCLGALNGWILLQGQVPLAAANDGLLPQFFKKQSRFGTPAVGLIVSAIFATVFLSLTLRDSLVQQFTVMISLATFATLLMYLLTSMARLLLTGEYKLSTILISCTAFAYSYWAIVGAGQQIVYLGILLLFSGVPIYILMHKKTL